MTTSRSVTRRMAQREAPTIGPLDRKEDDRVALFDFAPSLRAVQLDPRGDPCALLLSLGDTVVATARLDSLIGTDLLAAHLVATARASAKRYGRPDPYAGSAAAVPGDVAEEPADWTATELVMPEPLPAEDDDFLPRAEFTGSVRPRNVVVIPVEEEGW